MKNAAVGSRSEAEAAGDPLVLARRDRRTLFPPLQNRLLAQAANALAEDRWDVAEPLILKFLARHAEDADALNLLADVARRKGDYERAERLTARCVELAPDSIGYRFNYAVILRRRDKFDESLAQLDTLLRDQPQNAAFRDQKAAVLRLLGRLVEALAYRRQLVEEYPSSAEAWLHYAHALRGQGSSQECAAAYSRVLELAPWMGEAYMHLANLKTYKFTRGQIEEMERLLRDDNVSPQQRADVCFALGKAYSDEKLYRNSFEHYARGNALRRMETNFDPSQLSAFTRNCEALFSERYFRDRAGWGHVSDAPIFIVGMPRSGSTLVEQILSSHSQVEALGERPELDVEVGNTFSAADGGKPAEFWIGGWFEFRPKLARALPRILPEMTPEAVRDLAQRYLRAVQPRRLSGAARFTDKALRNFGYTGLILLMFPNAKIVDARRHPLDCGWSCFKSHFPGGQPFANRLTDIGSHYANYVRLMTHFDRALPGRIHRVIYEDLVADPESEVHRLLAYCGLPFEEQCLRFYENTRAVATLSSEQVRRPLYKPDIPEWQHYNSWLGPLKSALGPVLDSYPAAPAQGGEGGQLEMPA